MNQISGKDYAQSSGIALTGVAVVLVVQTALRGVAILATWNWFIAEYFHVRSLNFFNALGISLFFSALMPYVGRPWSTWRQISDWNMLKEDVFRTVAGPVMVTVVAWVWYSLGTL